MIEINKLLMIFKKAPFQVTLTIISFVLFIAVYLFITMTAIEPYYLEGLVFALPFICFGLLAYFTTTGKLKVERSTFISIIMIFILGLLMFFSFILLVIDAATTETTDIEKYQRVLKVTGYPDDKLTSYFPSKIPKQAKNIVFLYHPAIGQGGESFQLKFKTDSLSIENYVNEFSQKAIWIGKVSDSDASEYGIYPDNFDYFDYYDTLPEDFTIYLFVGNSDDWNHGELSLVAISTRRNEIIFLAEDW